MEAKTLSKKTTTTMGSRVQGGALRVLRQVTSAAAPAKTCC